VRDCSLTVIFIDKSFCLNEYGPAIFTSCGSTLIAKIIALGIAIGAGFYLQATVAMVLIILAINVLPQLVKIFTCMPKFLICLNIPSNS
jgi:hypothetical protein